MEELIPRKTFTAIIKVLDAIMPWAVILSIIGLIFEYTFIADYGQNAHSGAEAGVFLGHGYVGLINIIFDIFFAIDVILRTIAFSKTKQMIKNYMGRGLGWVDWLAAIPGFLIPIQAIMHVGAGAEVFRGFKVARIGKFLRIIRLLRALRFFKFLEKMNKDSVFIQKHIMTLVLSITLMTIAAISVMDISLGMNEDTQKELAHTVFPQDTIGLNDPMLNAYLEQNEEAATLLSQLETEHDHGMLIILVLLTFLLLMIIFYFGPKLAKDVRRVQLVVDSIDADDYFLVQEEAEVVAQETGSSEMLDSENEMASLIKVVNEHISNKLEEIQARENEIEIHEKLVSDREEFIQMQEAEISKTVERIMEEYFKAGSQSSSDDLASLTGGLMDDMDSLSMDTPSKEVPSIDDFKKAADEVAVSAVKRFAKSFFSLHRKILKEELDNLKDDLK